MTYISFCSGIEAATVAWESLSWTPLAFCEIDKAPSRVLAHHYRDVPNLGDFTAVDWAAWTGKADICVGGTPCQAFSVAGLRKSLADERGNLSLEFIRAVNIIRPTYVVWENVPGVLSTSDNAFGCFLAGLVGCEEPIVFESGWPNAGVVDGPIRRCAWRVLDAQYFGLAQRRRRVFVIASSGDGPHPAEILFEWEGLRRDSPPSREAGEGFTRESAPCLTGSGRGVERGGDSRGQDPVIAMRLTAKGGGGRLDGESETLVAGTFQNTGQGWWSDNDVACGLRDGSAGGASHSNVVTHSLRADGFDASEDGTGRGTPLVACTAPTLTSNGDAHSGYRDDRGLVPVAIQAGALRENPNSGPDGVGVQEHIAYTIEARAEVQAVGNGMAVRRLTPRECERLQGFNPVFEIARIQGCFDHQKNSALVEVKNLKWQCSAWNADVSEYLRFARTAPVSSHASLEGHALRVAVIVPSLSEAVSPVLLSETAGCKSNASNAEKQGWSQRYIDHADFAVLLAPHWGKLAKETTAGKAESHPSIRLSFLAENGNLNAGKSGEDSAVSVRDATFDASAAKSITLHLGYATPTCSSPIATLLCSVIRAISSFIPSETSAENFCLDLVFKRDYTAIPGMADGPRYKMLGNSFAVPVVRWLGERIQAAVRGHGK